MKRIRGRDDHRIHCRISEHGVVVGECRARFVHGGHPCEQIGCNITDRIKLGVPRLAHGVEVRELRDLSGTEDADTDSRRLSCHALMKQLCALNGNSNDVARPSAAAGRWR